MYYISYRYVTYRALKHKKDSYHSSNECHLNWLIPDIQTFDRNFDSKNLEDMSDT